AERDMAAAAERQVERRPEERRAVHRGVERLGLLELERGDDVLLVGPERILEREEVAHLPRRARRICRQLASDLRLGDEPPDRVSREELGVTSVVPAPTPWRRLPVGSSTARPPETTVPHDGAAGGPC